MDKYDDRRGVGCCPNPAHDDKTPSCSYNPQTYTYHCFGCGQSWDYITAHMQARNSSFIDACKDLFEAADVQYDFTEHGLKNRRQYYYPEPRYAPNKDMLNYVASQGVIYFAFTTKISVCKDRHAFMGTTTCPICGEPIADTYSRVVGFYTPISSYQKIRKREFSQRKWYDVLTKNEVM